jgi:hypothetical protein
VILHVVGDLGVESVFQSGLAVPTKSNDVGLLLRSVCKAMETLDAAILAVADVAGQALRPRGAEWVGTADE